jgi:hypothetical protein
MSQTGHHIDRGSGGFGAVELVVGKIYRSRQKGVEEVIGVGVFESTRFFTLALYYERVYQTAVYLTSSSHSCISTQGIMN